MELKKKLTGARKAKNKCAMAGTNRVQFFLLWKCYS